MDRKVPDNFHALYDHGFRAARGALPTPSAQAETVGHKRLAADVPDLEVDYDEATQLPNRVVSRQPTARLSSDRSRFSRAGGTQFIQHRGDLWNLTPEDVATVEVVSVSRRA